MCSGSIFIAVLSRLHIYDNTNIPVKRKWRVAMSEVVVLGAGLGGTLATYEILPQLLPGDRLTLIGQDARYHFVPSNPWVAVGWRDRADIEADLSDIMQKKGVRYLTQGAQHVDPQARHIELNHGE